MLTKQEFLDKIASGVRILDGATGSNLRAKGMPNGCSTEQWVMKAGETRRFADVSIQVLITADEKYPGGLIYTHNSRSAVIRATFTQDTYNTSDDKTALLFGDSGGDSRCKWMMTRYGSQILKSDVMQVIHHGLAGGYLPIYQVVDPEIVLWPTPQSRFEGKWDSDSDGEYDDEYQWCTTADFNAWLRDDSIRERQHHANGYTTVIDMSDLSVSVFYDYA